MEDKKFEVESVGDVQMSWPQETREQEIRRADRFLSQSAIIFAACFFSTIIFSVSIRSGDIIGSAFGLLISAINISAGTFFLYCGISNAISAHTKK